MSETWRVISGFAGYEVSDQGRVRSYRVDGPADRLHDTPHVLKPRTDKGYARVPLRRGGKKVWKHVHQLVLEAFVGARPSPVHQGCHINGSPDDNRPCNLRWGTALDNAADKQRHGTMACGERHGCAKLTAEQAGEIRLLKGTLSQRKLAAMYGVSRRAVTFIHHGKTWRSVTQAA